MEKMNFRQKIENFWYHNKFATIVITIFAIFAIVSLVQILTKNKPDANFMYMGPASVAFAGEGLIQESMAEVMREDYNKDGKKYIDYIELTSVSTENANDTDGDFATGYTAMQVQRTVGESFAAQIIAGDSMIYLLDEQYYKVAENTGVLMPLSEALGYTPDIAINDYAVYLSDLDIYYLPGIKLLPKSTLLCVRYPVTLTSGKTEVEERERCNLSVFRDMFSYVYDDKPIVPEEEEHSVMTLDEFKSLLTDYNTLKGLNLSQGVIETATDITPEGFYNETGANLFKVGSATYIGIYKKIYPIGKHIGGAGLLDIEVCNFNGDEQNDIIFSYSFSGADGESSSVSIFNLTDMKETFLSIDSQAHLTLNKINDTSFELLGENKVLAIIEKNGESFDIIYKS